MDNKKISFGFNKVSKKAEIVPKVVNSHIKKQLIDCVEDQSIKVVGETVENKGLLVIPLQGSSNKIVDRIKEKRLKTEIKLENEVPESELTLDELAARELIRDAQNKSTLKSETKVFTLPLLKEEKFVAEGATESSLNDYENVPISDYGMAMLRGMNWSEGMPIGKRTKKAEVLKLPELRPRGLGLGANKLVNSSLKNSEPVDKDGKKMQLVKGAFCKIIAGNHRGHYCEVQGFDDEGCRVIVKTSISKEVLSLNEFLIALVSKEDYEKGSRVINNAKYEEYQTKSQLKNENRSRSGSRERSKKKKHKSERRKHKKHKKKFSGSNSDSDYNSKRHVKNK